MKLFKKITKAIVLASILTMLGVSLLSNVNTSAQVPVPVSPPTGTTTGATGGGATNAGAITINPTVLCNSANGCPVLGTNINAADKNKLSAFILSIARFITFIAGAIAVVVIVISGVQRMNISDAEAAKNSDKNLTNAAIGLAIAILAYTIVGVLSVFLVGNFFGN
jgi:Type IV secretion system pilin